MFGVVLTPSNLCVFLSYDNEDERTLPSRTYLKVRHWRFIGLVLLRLDDLIDNLFGDMMFSKIHLQIF